MAKHNCPRVVGIGVAAIECDVDVCRMRIVFITD